MAINFSKRFVIVGWAFLAGCANGQHGVQAHPVMQSRMTEAQAIAAARPYLPLPDHESYHAQFNHGIWTVSAEPDPGFQQRSWSTVTVRDSDGQVIGVTSF